MNLHVQNYIAHDLQVFIMPNKYQIMYQTKGLKLS